MSKLNSAALATAILVSLGTTSQAVEPKRLTLPPATQVFHRTIEVDGLDIFYREAGPPDAPAVL